MCRGEEYSFATSLGGKIIVEAIVNNKLLQALALISRQQAEFGELTSEAAVDAFENLAAFLLTLLRKGQLKVLQPYATQSTKGKIRQFPYTDAKGSRCRTR